MAIRRLGSILHGLVLSSLASACGGAVSKDDSAGVGGTSSKGGSSHGGTRAEGGFSAGGSPAGGAAAGGAFFVSSAGGAASGAGGASGVAAVPLCENGEPLLTKGFSDDVSADYVGLYLLDAQGQMASLYQMSGRLCAGASSSAECAANVQAFTASQTKGFALRPEAPQPLSPARSSAYLLVTSGDSVTPITDEASLRAFLGPIDTPNEAALRYFLAGYTPLCNSVSMTETPEGYGESFGVAAAGCGRHPEQYFVSVQRDATMSVVVTSLSEPCVGRRPAGLLPAHPAEPGAALGSYFASVARLEAAAVRAFEIMIGELELFDAPHELVSRAKSARADEIRHAWEFGRLAAEHGATPLALEIAPSRERSLLEIALENAAEGVVRETWGALHAAWQAEAVTDAQLRDLFSVIAEDEAEHASLSLAVDEWIQGRLDEDERVVVELEKRRALAELRAELASHEPHSAVVVLAGVPDRERALDLFARFEREFFGPSKASTASARDVVSHAYAGR